LLFIAILPISAQQTMPPTAANGNYNFHLVEEAGLWNAQAIVPLIAPPAIGGSGASHPAE